MLFCRLLIFFKSQMIFSKSFFLNKFFQENDKNVKQVGSVNVMSDLDTICLTL